MKKLRLPKIKLLENITQWAKEGTKIKHKFFWSGNPSPLCYTTETVAPSIDAASTNSRLIQILTAKGWEYAFIYHNWESDKTRSALQSLLKTSVKVTMLKHKVEYVFLLLKTHLAIRKHHSSQNELQNLISLNSPLTSLPSLTTSTSET